MENQGQDPTPPTTQPDTAFDNPEAVAEDNDVVEGEEAPPVSNGEDPGDPGDDPDVPNEVTPEHHALQSVEADQQDQRGEGV